MENNRFALNSTKILINYDKQKFYGRVESFQLAYSLQDLTKRENMSFCPILDSYIVSFGPKVDLTPFKIEFLKLFPSNCYSEKFWFDPKDKSVRIKFLDYLLNEIKVSQTLVFRA